MIVTLLPFFKLWEFNHAFPLNPEHSMLRGTTDYYRPNFTFLLGKISNIREGGGGLMRKVGTIFKARGGRGGSGSSGIVIINFVARLLLDLLFACRLKVVSLLICHLCFLLISFEILIVSYLFNSSFQRKSA